MPGLTRTSPARLSIARQTAAQDPIALGHVFAVVLHDHLSDVDGDEDLDLLVVGEYLPIKVFVN